MNLKRLICIVRRYHILKNVYCPGIKDLKKIMKESKESIEQGKDLKRLNPVPIMYFDRDGKQICCSTCGKSEFYFERVRLVQGATK